MKVEVNILVLLFLLLDNLYLPFDLGFDFRLTYIAYFVYIIYVLFKRKKIFVNKNFIIISVLFIVISLLTSILKGSPTLLVVKQTILIYVNFLVAYLLLNSYDFDLIRIIKDYIKLIFIAAIIGLIQFISQNIGFSLGSDFSYLGFEMGNYEMLPNTRVQSWFYEPSFLVYAFMPVVFIVIGRFFNLTKLISIKKGAFILVVFILSRSAIGFLGLIVSLILIITYKYSVFRSPKVIISGVVLSLLLSVYIYRIPDIKFRIDDTLKLFLDENVSGEDVDKINLSTYAFYSNYKITVASVANNPILGTGLGTYEYNYDRYINTAVPKSNYRKFIRINYNDANSMFFRMLAETGLLATFFIIYLLLKKRVTNRFNLNQLQIITDYWLISNGIFVLIFLRLLRQGHYTMLGFVLFLLMYFYANKELNERVKETIQ